MSECDDLPCVVSIDSVAMLTTEDLSCLANGRAIELMGYHLPYDGGGGIFRIRDAELSEAPDDGITFELSDGRIAERVFSGTYDVRWFGTTGGGITDDTDALYRATMAASHSTLYLPKGSYLVSDTVYIRGSFFGDGAESLIIAASEVEFVAPVVVITGVGYSNAPGAYSLNSAFVGTPIGNACGAVIAAMQTEDRSCAWQSVIGAFQITTQSNHRATVTQNGLLVQQIAKFNIYDIRINKMNGFGFMEDSTQDAVFSNMAMEECGSGDSGKETYSYVVDSVTDGGFSSSSRVQHFYTQNELCTWGAFYTGNIGSRGTGLGGSSENGWYGTHQEVNSSYPNKTTFRGLLDCFVHCSVNSQNMDFSCARNKFVSCDFSGATEVLLGPTGSDSEVNYFTDCTSLPDVVLKCGTWYFKNSSFSSLSVQLSANGRIVLDDGTVTSLIDGTTVASVGNGIYVNSCASLTLSATNTHALDIHVNGGELRGSDVPNTYFIQQTGGNFTITGEWNLSYQFGRFVGVLIDAPINLGGGTAYTPEFVSCRFARQPFLTTGQTGARFLACHFEAGLNVPLTGTAVACTVLAGQTFVIGNQVGCSFTDGTPTDRGSAIATPSGGVFIDVQARAAISALLSVARSQKMIAP